jgi:hypothetical protein
MNRLSQLTNPLGSIQQPAELSRFGTIQGGGLAKFIQLILRLMIIGAGLYALFNIIFAGYAFLSAGGDSKKIEGAWGRIWQSLLGLAIAGGSFVLAAIFGQLLFGRADFILNPVIPTI